MKPLHLLYALAIVAASAFFGVDTASAQATRTWVSGVGDDVNPCSRTAPCKTFAGAISKTAARGEINCLDPGGFGTVTITKSITIDCTGTIGSILNSSTNGVNVNDSASGSPNTIDVILRGLSINGGATTSPGLNGIRYVSGRSLRLEDVVIFNQTAGVPSGHGINISPSAQSHDIIINDTKIYNNGAPNTGTGIFINPTGSANVNLIVTNSSIDNNDLGIRISGLGSSGNVGVSISDTSASGNAREGIRVEGDGTDVNLLHINASANGTGVTAAAPGLARIGSSIVSNNNVGVSGNVLSFGNNQLAGNTVQNALGPVGLQSIP